MLCPAVAHYVGLYSTSPTSVPFTDSPFPWCLYSLLLPNLLHIPPALTPYPIPVPSQGHPRQRLPRFCLWPGPRAALRFRPPRPHRRADESLHRQPEGHPGGSRLRSGQGAEGEHLPQQHGSFPGHERGVFQALPHQACAHGLSRGGTAVGGGY